MQPRKHSLHGAMYALRTLVLKVVSSISPVCQGLAGAWLSLLDH